MSFFEFPHTRTYDTDLGWLIRRVIEMSEELRHFVNFNTIKYADPIAWDITTQYEGNTVVINPANGTAYISTRPVPSGVLITNTDYWTPIFNYGESIDRLHDQIESNNEYNSPVVTHAYSVGDLFWQDGYLYRVIVDMPVGTAIVPGTNVENTTVMDELESRFADALAELQQTLDDGLKSKLSVFDVVADMKADTVLIPGDYAETGGYYQPGTGGALYKIVETEPSSYYEQLDSGLYAQLIPGLSVYPDQFGAYGDGTHNDFQALQNAFDSGAAVKLRSGATYETGDGRLFIKYDHFSLDGQGARILKNRESTQICEFIRTDGFDYITIKNVDFYGDLNISNIWSEHIHGVAINNSNHVEIEGCRFDNIEGDGVYIGGLGRCTDVQVKNCYFGKTGRWGLSVIDGVGIMIDSNLFYENITACIDLEPNQVDQTNDVTITGNSSVRCAELVNAAYGRNHTGIAIVVDGWHSYQDSVLNADTTRYPDKVNIGLFSIRLSGGAIPQGTLELKNISVIKAREKIFYERVASAAFIINISGLSIIDCSGDVAIFARTDWTGLRITRQVEVNYDNCSYTNFAELFHPEDVARGDIIYNVHKSGNVPDSILGHPEDRVNLYDVYGILLSKPGPVTTDAGTLVVNKMVEYEHFIMLLIYFTPSANIAANGKVFDFTTGEGNTGWYFFGGGTPVFFYDNGASIRTAAALTAGTSYRGYIIYMGK